MVNLLVYEIILPQRPEDKKIGFSVEGNSLSPIALAPSWLKKSFAVGSPEGFGKDTKAEKLKL